MRGNKRSGRVGVRRNVAKRKRGNPGLEGLEGRTLLTAIVVNTSDDTTGGSLTSLRDAIQLANDTPGHDTITFDLGPSPTPIVLGSALPELTGAVDILGNSQPGYAGVPLVVIDGHQLVDSTTFEPSATGLDVRGG